MAYRLDKEIHEDLTGMNGGEWGRVSGLEVLRLKKALNIPVQDYLNILGTRANYIKSML